MSGTREMGELISPDTGKLCPNCGKKNRERYTFCVKCGAELPETVATQTVRKTGPLAKRSEAMLSSEKQRILPPITDLLVPHSVSRSLQEIYFDLGVALSGQKEYKGAVEALEKALATPESSSPTAELEKKPEAGEMRLYLAYAYEQLKNTEQAFHNYIEVLLHETAHADVLFRHAQTLLMPDIALLEGKWVIAECEPRINDTHKPASIRMYMALLIGRIHLYLGNYAQAQEYFKKAMLIAPEETSSVASELLMPAMLPAAIGAYETDSKASSILAQLYQIIGNFAQATAYIDHAIELSHTNGQALDITAYQLKAVLQADAELRKTNQNKEEAALALFNTAQDTYYKNDFKLALTLLQHVLVLQPEHISAHWYLADSLLLWNPEIKNIEERRTLLNECLDIWEQGYQLLQSAQHMDDDNAWAYIIRSRICEQQSYLPDMQPWPLLWKAVSSTEQAMLYEASKNASAYTFLGRFYRNVQMEANALELHRTAITFAEGGTYALSELVITLSNTGGFEEAAKVIERWRTLEEDQTFVTAILGYIAWYEGRIDDSITLLSTAIQNDLDVIWYRATRAYAYRMCGNFTAANKDAQWLWQRYQEGGAADIENMSRYADAAYFLGKIAEALEILEKIKDSPFQDACSNALMRGYCYLAQGKIAPGQASVEHGISLIINQRQIIDTSSDLEDLLKNSQDWPYRQEIHDVVQHLKEQVTKRQNEIASPRSSEAELTALIEQIESEEKRASDEETHRENGAEETREASETKAANDKSDGWAWIAARAGRARIYYEQKRWIEGAIDYYLLYQKARARFPEARLGLESVYDHLLDDMAQLLQSQQSDSEYFAAIWEALGYLADTLQDDKMRLARGFTQAAYYSLLKKQYEDTAKLFIYALFSYQEAGAPDPGKACAEVCCTLLPNAADYWTLRDVLTTIAEDVKESEFLQTHFITARDALGEYLTQHYQLSEQDEASFLPITNPIAVELGLNLIPPEARDPDKEWKFLKEYIPQMRQRLEQETGIEIPGVRLRDNSGLEPTAYAFLINETPVARGNASAGSTDPFLAIVDHLEKVLRKNLAAFVGMQELTQLLARQRNNEQVAAFERDILSDADARFHFTRLIQALLRESIPVTDFARIISALQDVDLVHGTMNEIVRHVRDSLKSKSDGEAEASDTAHNEKEMGETRYET